MHTQAWLRLFLALLLGFWLGVLLGFFSSFLMYSLLPAQWMANGFEARKARHERFLLGRECRRNGFFERFDAVANAVRICACWADGVGSAAFVQISCSTIERSGYGELGLG